MIIVAAAALLGTVDLIYACSFWYALHDVPPARILRGIASGWLGSRAYTGGPGVLWLGAASHYGIMMAMVLTYAMASHRIPLLLRRPWRCGAFYGLLLYVVMNGIVVPLSAAAGPSLRPAWVIGSLIVHVWLIGVPIAWSARWAAGDAEVAGRHAPVEPAG